MVLVEARPASGWRDHPLSITRWKSLGASHGGERFRITCDTLIQWVSRPAIIPGIEETKFTLDGWSPGFFEHDHRKKENALELSVLVLDFDKHLDNVGRVVAAFRQYAGIVHTTKKHLARIISRRCGCGGKDASHEWSSTETSWLCTACGREHRRDDPEDGVDVIAEHGPRCRVLLPYSRPINSEEHARIWLWALRLAQQGGFVIDDAPKDPSRFWYAPAHLPGGVYEVHVLEGALLDPAEALLEVAAPTSIVSAFVAASKEWERTRPPPEAAPTEPSQAIEVLLAEIAGCPHHGRNTILSRNAFFVFQRVNRGELDENVARERLYQAANTCAQKTNRGDSEDLTEIEIRGCIERARTSAINKPWDAPLLTVYRGPVDRVFQGFSDADYAAGFIIQHAEDVRAPVDQGWLVWDGRRWAREAVKSAKKLMLDFARQVTEDTGKIEDEDFKKKAYAFAKLGESHAKISSALGLAAHETGIRIDPKEIERQPYRLTCLNGTVDLTTGALLPFKREDLITHLVPTAYKPDAKAPRWLRFMDEVTLGRPGLIDFLHKWIGYCLTGDVSEQCYVLATGTGGNGKGKMAEALRSVLGPDITTPQPPRLLLVSKGERHPTELKVLEDKRVVFVSEVKKGAQFDDERLKLLTGGDAIQGRGMRENFTTIEPTAKLWIYVNDAPQVSDQSDAFWRRVRRVPFDAKFKDERNDPNLLEKLQAEAEGILAWAIEGCLRWRQERLPMPEEVLVATKAYQGDQDDFQRFLDDYEAADKKIIGTSTNELFQAYVVWCQRERTPEIKSQTAFTWEVKRLGYEIQTAGARVRVWVKR